MYGLGWWLKQMLHMWVDFFWARFDCGASKQNTFHVGKCCLTKISCGIYYILPGWNVNKKNNICVVSPSSNINWDKSIWFTSKYTLILCFSCEFYRFPAVNASVPAEKEKNSLQVTLSNMNRQGTDSPKLIFSSPSVLNFTGRLHFFIGCL